jgi:hypothetical protein
MSIFLVFFLNEYEKLVGRIENAESSLLQSDNGLADFSGADRRNHPTILKVEMKRY